MSQDRLGGYKYIKPLLECNIAEEDQKELANFKEKVEENISKQKNEGSITEASVYFFMNENKFYKSQSRSKSRINMDFGLSNQIKFSSMTAE